MGRLATSEISRITVALTAAMIFYFVWMDLILYNTIQGIPLLRPSKKHSFPQDYNGSGDHGVSDVFPLPQDQGSHVKEVASIFSPFEGLSIKLMMMDHMNHYVATPIANSITKVFHMESQLLWITPNFLSLVGVVLCVCAARCISWEGRNWHLLAVVLMFFRDIMDALDGMIARDRQGIHQHLSLHNTSGFYVDGIADTAGYTIFILGCFIYLKRTVPKQYQPLLVLYQSEEKAKTKRKGEIPRPPSPNGSGPGQQWTSQRIFLVLFCSGLQLMATAALWDRYCTGYHQLLETPRDSEPQMIVQNEVIKSALMWLVIWLWRVSNSHAFINFLLFSITLNKMWEFFLFIQFIGIAEIFTLFLLTEIHYRDVTAYVNMVS